MVIKTHPLLDSKVLTEEVVVIAATISSHVHCALAMYAVYTDL